MKKLVLILALAIGVPVVSTTTSVVSAQTCDINSPCLYSGQAQSDCGKGSSSLSITVKFAENSDRFVAETRYGTFYVFINSDCDDYDYYINVSGTKYYFNM